MSRCYFDALSGQPLADQALAAVSGFIFQAWADPEQPHHEGAQASQILEAARQTVAVRLGVSSRAVSFHPSNVVAELAVNGILRSVQGGSHPNRNSVLTSRVERDDILRATSAFGTPIRVGVDSNARVNVSQLRDAIDDSALPLALVALQAANAEVGTIQPLAEVLRYTAAVNLPLLVDATGALGLIEIEGGWSALIADAATWAGPRGVSVLVINPSFRWQQDPRERGVTALVRDTVDVLNSTAAAAALDSTMARQPALSDSLKRFTTQIRQFVGDQIADIDVLGDPDNRLPHVVTFSVLYADGERLARELDAVGVAIGSGSACAARAGLPSHVLVEMGALTHGNVRLSLPVNVTQSQVEYLMSVLPKAINQVRADAGV
jgi:cysteine desulfurase